jgi:hypothetical protein
VEINVKGNGCTRQQTVRSDNTKASAGIGITQINQNLEALWNNKETKLTQRLYQQVKAVAPHFVI